ncbi:hypothetical protein ApAK_04155 [Thermoplasmatales archaeon AK]|nr:hypothetical protein [Thermoplasmatales archaeon AK]
MKIKIPALLFVAISVVIAGSVLPLVGNPADVNSQAASYGSGNTIIGNITILPNGTITPVNSAVTHSGNVFELGANITGSLTFMASNSVLEGGYHAVTDPFNNSSSIIISGSSSSSVEDVTAASTNLRGLGIEIKNSSQITLSKVTASSHFIALGILQNVTHGSITSSSFYVNSTGSTSLGISVGINVSDLHNIGSLINTLGVTNNITFEHDTVSVINATANFLTVSNGTVFEDSNFLITGNEKNNAGSAIGAILSNNSKFQNNTASATNVTFGILNGNFGVSSVVYHGDRISNNSFSINTRVLEFGFFSLSPTMITGNTFTGNLGQQGLPELILDIANGTSISGNTFSFNNTSATNIYAEGDHLNLSHNFMISSNASDFAGIQAELFNSTVLANSILTASAPDFRPVSYYGIYVTGMHNTINSNTVSLANTSSSETAGIYVEGGGSSSSLYSDRNSISYNSVTITNNSGYAIELGSGLYGISNTIVTHNDISISGKEPNGIIFLGSNNTISDNYISMNSTVSSTGIGSFGFQNSSSYDTISGNVIHSYKTATGGIFGFYFDHGLTHSSITGNTFSSVGIYGSGVELVTSNYAFLNVASNSFHFADNSTSQIYGMIFASLYNSTVSNNTLYYANHSIYWSNAQHDVVNGNYLYNQYEVISLSDSSNLTFYQNDFINFTKALSITNSNNLSFNLSYPVGGNYWSNYTGSDRYSGPSQNKAGSDGIGDTPYTIGYGYVDHYPLMKPWTRPVVTFIESGLSPGTAWSVTFNGKNISSDNSEITFTLVDSTYQIFKYSITSVNGYYQNLSSGNFSYGGLGASYTIEYLKYAHLYGTVTPGVVSIKIGNTTYNVTNGVYNLSIKAGNYTVQFIHSGYLTKTYSLTLTPGEEKNLSVVLAKPVNTLYYVAGGIGAAAVIIGALVVIMRRKQ